jgi:hypothetical protein
MWLGVVLLLAGSFFERLGGGLAMTPEREGVAHRIGGPGERALLRSTIATLLGNGHLLLVSSAGDGAQRDFDVSPLPVSQATSNVMVQSVDGRHLVVLAPSSGPAGSQLFVVDLHDTSSQRLDLPDSQVTFTSLALGRRTGSAYITGFWRGGVVIARYSIDPLVSRERRVERRGQGARWPVYATSIDAEERRFYVSYHGTATGVDVFALNDAGPAVCPTPELPNAVCFASHGGVIAIPDGVLLATGEAGIRYVRDRGTEVQVDIGLRGNHLMEFSFDSATRTVVAAGSCGYAGGFAIATLPEGATATEVSGRELVRPVDYTVCGERLAIAPDGSWAAVAKRAPPPYASTGPGELTIVEVRTGRVLNRIRVAAPPIDVLVLR